MSTAVTTPTLKTGYGSPALSVDEARARILSELAPLRQVESLALGSALGRVLAQNVISPINVPAQTNAAVDGYALAGAELPSEGEKEFRVIGTAWAGRPFAGSVERGECIRIMTGASMALGTDTAIMQERVLARGDVVVIRGGHTTGENVRAAGEDLAQGQVALAAGKRLMPVELGLLASLGLTDVSVYRRLRVALFSTGDELRSIGEPLRAGEIYDSNRYSLLGMLTRLGVEVRELGVARDERETVRRTLTDAAKDADVVITSGGVSVGEADYIKEMLEALGQVSFWQIAMRPGRPLAFGHIGNAAFFGLPGNPVAVMVTFYQFVRLALLQMMGASGTTMPPTFRVRCTCKFKTRPGRTDFMRGILERDARGELVVRSTGGQGSGILSSMSRANCFVILGPELADVEPGATVEVQPFEGII